VACWDVATGTWSALGTGTNDYVWGLALVGRDLFVVGKFTLAGGTVANRVARWNRDEGAWHALGTGLNGEAYTVASTGDDVFVGGAFSEAGGVPASHIARWRPSFSVWTSLGSGTNGVVASLGVRQESIGVIQYHMVYAGGNFTQAGGASASNVAVWNGFSGTWSPLGAGVDGRVRGIRLVDKRVYAGGVFDTAGGVPASRIACWDGSSWLPLGSGTNGYVFSMDAAAYSLFVVGSMSEAGGHAVTGIARWIMPYLFLTSPNGGELWRRGETRPITWSAVGITQPLTIELRRDGVTLGVIASGLDSVAGSFDWTVGRLESGDWVTGDGLGILVRTGSGEALAETTLGK